MKVTKIEHVDLGAFGSEQVNDCNVDMGYIQGPSGSLPDVDVDYQSDKRQEVKAYTEQRYNHDGKQRVLSAGTFTTLKAKAVIKDVARTMRLPIATVNYLTAMIEDDNADWTELFRMAKTNPRLYDLMERFPKLFEDIRPLMGSPRSSSIHASALLITPDEKDGKDYECFDFIPIKKEGNLLVSENTGVELDELGLLKNDCLATKELSILREKCELVNSAYGTHYNFDKLMLMEPNDPEVFEMLSVGATQSVFQFSSKGITGMLKELRPTCIEDLIAANALYRPATLDSGSVDDFINRKNGLVEPTYYWGTEEILRETYGIMVYQEELSKVAQVVGKFSVSHSIQLVKYISKKKKDKIRASRKEFMDGAIAQGCPEEDANAIWDVMEAAGRYCFNKCIRGTERIRRLSNGKATDLTIADMYKICHDSIYAAKTGHMDLRSKYRSHGYGNGWSMDRLGKVKKNKIVDIRYMGIRPVYRITLETGETIDVTDNHKHPTNHGIKRTDELVPGVDSMYVCIGYCKENTSYRFTDKGSMNNPQYHSNAEVVEYKMNSQKGHAGFTKRESGYTLLERYRREKMPNYCEMCGKTEVRLEIHHKDGIHAHVGDNYSNLITLCPSCHKKEHYKMGRVKQGFKGLGTRLALVVSVEYLCDDEVYDVEMADPHHNFCTGNNVITCNSHSTAYALTAYWGAWLKCKYPTATYTVALKWASDDKELQAIMSEMDQYSRAKLVPPDINRSNLDFTADFVKDEILWSLTRIKMCTAKSMSWILDEREKNGKFESIEQFIDRIFKYKLKMYRYWDDPDNEDEVRRCPVNARHVLNLIMAGAFDVLENVTDITDRYLIIDRAAKKLGIELKESDFPVDLISKHYFWSQQQQRISGLGAIDYRKVFDNSKLKPNVKGKCSYRTLNEILDKKFEGRKVAICCTVADVVVKKYESHKTGRKENFAKLTLQQGLDLSEVVIWSEEYEALKDAINSSKDKIVCFTASVKFDEYSKMNKLQFTRTTLFEII